jgi:hypothetical protein
MIYAAFLVLILLAGLAAAAFIARRRASGVLRRRALRVALVIAAVRLVVLWSSTYFLAETADARQLVGYPLIILDCLVEMVVVKPWRNDLPVWLSLLSVLVTVTSVALGYAWALAAVRFRSSAQDAG